MFALFRAAQSALVYRSDESLDLLLINFILSFLKLFKIFPLTHITYV
jgi:hypothetical protein